MGNYYAGMINNTGGYGELKHHGILGQKWGVRRFQNADGSLTAAGRERYGSSEEKRKLSKIIVDGKTPLKKLRKLPQVRDAARQLENSEEAKQRKKYADKCDELTEGFYKNNDIYTKYLNKAIDKYMEEYPDRKSERDNIEWLFKYDDLDQGTGSSFDLWSSSNEPEAKEYREAEKKYFESTKALYSKARSIAKDILGEESTTLIRKEEGKHYPVNMNTSEDRLANILYYNSKALLK